MTVTDGAPAVPGLLLERRLGSGEHGEVWRALDVGAGDVGAELVAVVVGRPAAGAGAAARESALLRGIAHENVVRLRCMLDLPDGRRALVTDFAPGGDLATLVRRRGPLRVGEVVTLTVALAHALEHVHALGFVHGALSPRTVLFTADGRPMVAGVGVPSLLAGRDDGAPPTYSAPAADVLALGRVVRFALTGDPAGEVGGRLAGVVAACTAPDADARPSPGQVAASAWDAGPPEPIAVTGPDSDAAGIGSATRPPASASGSPSEDRAGAQRAVIRGLVLTGGAIVVVALTASVFLAVRGSATAAPQVGQRVPLPSPAADALADPRALVAALAGARARAFTTPSAAPLADVDAPRSAAQASDAAFVQRLRQLGWRLSDLTFTVPDAQVLVAEGSRATVQAHVVTSGYLELRADGSVARRVPASSARTVRLALVRTAAGWRIASDG